MSQQKKIWSIAYLDIICNEDLTKVKHLQHRGRIVVTDAVALEYVLGGGHLPRQPALSKSSIEWQHVGEVAGLTAAAALILLHPLCDGLYLSLLTVGTWTDVKQMRIIFTGLNTRLQEKTFSVCEEKSKWLSLTQIWSLNYKVLLYCQVTHKIYICFCSYKRIV